MADLLDIEPTKISKMRSGERRFQPGEYVRAGQWLDQIEAKGAARGSDVAPDQQSTRNASADDATVEIIALDLSLSMGPGTMIEDFVEAEPIKFDLGMVRAITRTSPSRLRLVRGIGESMEPTIRTSDQVMIDINERQLTRINGIYWIDHLGMHGIKRLRAAGRGKVMIISDNPVVENFEVDAEDLRIEGRAIWFAREL
ncbi:S24 family peptidase [Sphingomonas sp. ZT3P38]|uniref:S24 family peptidase n=1 Tax=Parasphingomonas zepuensis TaxID=3096161 RepID=UPI002FCA1F2B